MRFPWPWNDGMKKTLFALFILLLLSPGPVAEASWLIDAAKFSASVHGENSCQDCHGNIAEEPLHPDPGKVAKGLLDFFSADQCLTCHDSVQDNLQEGAHGTLKVDDPQAYSVCIQCHDPHEQLRIDREPADPVTIDPVSFSEADRACMGCHGLGTADDPEKIVSFCFQCHARTGTRIQEVTAQIIPLIDPGAYQSAPHAAMACMDCHPRAAAYNHAAQVPGDCRQCHLRHDEKVAHDAHLLVSCQACHLNAVEPFRNPKTQTVEWRKQRLLGTPLNIHAMERENDPAFCRRCHTGGNEVGAAAMVLPPKGLVCMPCHAATFSADAINIVALLIFAGGLVLMFSVVLTGNIANRPQAGFIQKIVQLSAAAFKAVFSPDALVILKALFLDVLLQRRLYQKSAWRWLIHSFIFLSFLFRFSWGLLALLLSLWKPEWPAVWSLLDKNNPTTAFLFDLSGMLILLGVILAFIRGFRRKNDLPPNLPGQDRAALSLIGGIVIVGFILEGMRMAMTGWPAGSAYAFIGYGISRLFTGVAGITEVYGYIWYLHAVITGAFVAYLPFSRLIHMIIAPVTLALSALTQADHTKNA